MWAKENGYQNLVTTYKKNLTNSLYVRKSIKKNSLKNNFNFLDLTYPLQENATSNLIHGPIDYHHFNKLGYEIVSDVVFKSLFLEN